MTSPAAALMPYRTEAIELIRSSTHAEPVKAALTGFVEHGLDVAAKRSENAAARNQTRAATIRAGIGEAIGALPLDQWGTATITQQRIARKGPAFYHLPNLPDIGTVRSVIEERKSLAPV